MPWKRWIRGSGFNSFILDRFGFGENFISWDVLLISSAISTSEQFPNAIISSLSLHLRRLLSENNFMSSLPWINSWVQPRLEYKMIDSCFNSPACLWLQPNFRKTYLQFYHTWRRIVTAGQCWICLHKNYLK